MNVGFKRIKWFSSRTAYQDMQAYRQRRAQAIKKHMDLTDSVNMAMSDAQQNKITGLTLLAAQAGMKRVQDMAKAKAAIMTKQIDDAQRVVDSAEATKSTTSTGTSTMLDTVV